MNKICLVVPTYKSDITMLSQALSCAPLFDEVIVHFNDYETYIQYGSLCKNYKVIYNPQQCRVEEALNECIKEANSNFILPFTDDDFFSLDNLKLAIDYVKSCDGNKDVIYYSVMVGNDKQGWKLWSSPIITMEKLRDNNLIPFSSIYHKSVWEKVGGYKDVLYSDWFFWLETLKLGFKFEYHPEPLYYHRNGHKETLANKQSKTFNKTEFLKRLDNEKSS